MNSLTLFASLGLAAHAAVTAIVVWMTIHDDTSDDAAKVMICLLVVIWWASLFGLARVLAIGLGEAM